MLVSPESVQIKKSFTPGEGLRAPGKPPGPPLDKSKQQPEQMEAATRLDYCNTLQLASHLLSSHRGQSHCQRRLVTPLSESRPGTSKCLQNDTASEFSKTMPHLTQYGSFRKRYWQSIP